MRTAPLSCPAARTCCQENTRLATHGLLCYALESLWLHPATRTLWQLLSLSLSRDSSPAFQHACPTLLTKKISVCLPNCSYQPTNPNTSYTYSYTYATPSPESLDRRGLRYTGGGATRYMVHRYTPLKPVPAIAAHQVQIRQHADRTGC